MVKPRQVVSLSTSATDWGALLQPRLRGAARIERTDVGVRLLRLPSTEVTYSDSELVGCEPNRWYPPLTLSIRARFSHPTERLRGTAGFGFWNEGIGPGVRWPRPPRALWYFFGAPPYDVPLAMGVSGHGFKAAVLDAQRPAFFGLLPLAPIGFGLMRIPLLYRHLWPIAQRAIGARERDLSQLDLTTYHDFVVDWRDGAATFLIDGQPVLTAPAPPGPLQLVIWIDNCYAIATPQGRFGFGLVNEPEPQWLEVERASVV